MAKLSILIPARNEMFLGTTIKNILENLEGDTEIIAVLDGYTEPIPEIPQDPRVKVLFYQQSIGQRAATNKACELSGAKYIMKVDAHCAFDKGFDVKMMQEMEGHDDWTMVPTMYNLHAFDWVCECGFRKYQGPKTPCDTCGKEMSREIVWKEKRNPTSNFYCFDNTLHFQYWRALGDRPESKGDIAETMSIQGSCFMLTRDKYWELDICDENHGSWGQQGVEVACKTWLSGGRLVVNKKTWYAHMFRTQADFGFPYPNPGISKARAYSRELWFGNKWPKAKYPLSWLINKFAPVPGWEKSVGVIYYTDNRLDENIMKVCQEQLKRCIGDKRLISVSLKPMELGDNIVINEERSVLTMFKQILAGLKAVETDIVFFCEHDVLYHPSHFNFIPERDDTFYYNMNSWHVRITDGHAAYFDHKATSGLCANRQLLIKEYEERVRRVEAEGFHRNGYEPGTRSIRRGGFSDSPSGSWKSEFPNIDIRHGGNLSVTRWRPEDFRSQRSCQNWQEADELPYWGNTKELMNKVQNGEL